MNSRLKRWSGVTPRWFVAACCAIGVSLSAPASALAAEKDANVFASQIGVFSALGELGVAYSRELGDLAELEAGAGLGLTGVQLSLMGKVGWSSAPSRFVSGVGAAYALPASSMAYASDGVWLNVDVIGYEWRLKSGWYFSVAGGGTYALSGIDKCPDAFPCSTTVRGSVAPQARFGVGTTF